MTIAETLKKAITQALQNLGIPEIGFTVEHPVDLSHGDYATNVAMVVAKQLAKSPKEVAQMVMDEMNKQKNLEITKIEIAGPGFINFTLSSEFFAKAIPEIISISDKFGKNEKLFGKKIMIEYTQPNPFKPFHIGHLMSNAIGESLSRVLEFSGADLIRANYQGDVGLHVAKALFGLQQVLLSDPLTAEFIGECYVQGNELYETDPNAKTAIDRINKAVYEKTDAEINTLYEQGKKITLDAFEEIYKILGTKFNYYFFESEAAEIGKDIVEKNIGKGIFEESEGAIVFKAEKYNPKLHTRVFITSQGLPTYDAKEIGLAQMKFKKEPDLYKSITTTAVEQLGVIAVAYEAIYQIRPELRGKLEHVMHGMMRLESGKMSSRKGNVVTGESLINDARILAQEKMTETDADLATIIGVGALKYSILKSSPGSDIIFDFEKFLSVEGDSGPYLQYTHARICSLIEKGNAVGITADYKTGQPVSDLEKILYRFPEIVEKTLAEYAPNHITTYLISVAQAFNSFYGANQIIDPANREISEHRLAIARATQIVLKNGLQLLGIVAPDKM